MADEFSTIDQIFRILSEKKVDQSPLRIPPGDDAALLTPLKNPVISTDCQRENIHFKTEWQTFYEIGYKAVSVTLSDLAASYATPSSLFINLGMPGTLSETSVSDLYSGLCDALKFYKCSLGGGNITASDSLTLDLFAVGEGSALFPTRSAARPGDGLYMTGSPGKARGGLSALSNGISGFTTLTDAFKNPTARFDAAKILMDLGISCVMDVSDGPAGDAAHIASASDISIEFNLSETDISQDLKDYCRKYGLPPIETAIAGGEEYELMFTCPPPLFHQIKTQLPEAVQIGNCLTFHGKHILNPPVHHQSYIHNTEN